MMRRKKIPLNRDRQRAHRSSESSDNGDSTTDSESILTPTFRQNILPKKNLSKYESLDYEICDSELYENSDRNTIEPALGKDVARWILIILIGVLVALVACFVNIAVEELSSLKYGFLKNSVGYYAFNGGLHVPYLYYVLLNVIPVAFGSFLVAYIEPVAAGSGVPLVKSYLNGIKIPRIVRIKTLFVKVFGVILSVVGGLTGGKEGPMIQSGSVIAAGISQGKSTTFQKDFGIFRYFRDDHEKRDFVVAGASSGVAAAFGTPIGGVLFSLEEAVSFWNPSLILRTLVGSIISSFTLNFVLSIYHGEKKFVYPGLFNFGKFEALPYAYYEIPIFMFLGCCGGIYGALWNHLNIKLGIFRERFIKQKWAKVFEAILVAIITASMASLMMFTISDCKPLGNDPTVYPVQLACKDNEYNTVAALWFQTPEDSVRAMFHDPPATFQIFTLIIFALVYFPLSCLTYGLSVSLGIFIPVILFGAAWGRLFAMTVKTAFPMLTFIEPGKYAIIGAAAQMGGVMRMIISLTAILIESTGNISFALPIMITLICAKWTGDLFNDGIYDTQIHVSKVPMLGWRVRRPYRNLKARNIMSQPPICIRLKDKLDRIVNILKKTPHNGFPVVDHIDENGQPGHLCGLILRSQLIIIIMQRYYDELKDQWQPNVSIETFRNEYPRYPSIDLMQIAKKDLKFTVDLKMFMNRSCNSAWEGAAVPKIFDTFRALGLRHLVVVDETNNVTGMITRKDFLEC